MCLCFTDWLKTITNTSKFDLTILKMFFSWRTNIINNTWLLQSLEVFICLNLVSSTLDSLIAHLYCTAQHCGKDSARHFTSDSHLTTILVPLPPNSFPTTILKWCSSIASYFRLENLVIGIHLLTHEKVVWLKSSSTGVECAPHPPWLFEMVKRVLHAPRPDIDLNSLTLNFKGSWFEFFV